MKKHILLIDDCEMMQRFLKPIFQDQFQVSTFNHPMDAYQWLMENDLPDVIVLDFELPGMSGLEFLRKLRAQATWADTPILMLSGVKDAEKRWQCLEAGADDFLAKPFHPRELALRVKLLCNRFQPALATA